MQWAARFPHDGTTDDKLESILNDPEPIRGWAMAAELETENRSLLAALKGLVPKCQNTPDRESLEYKECGRPAFYYASFGMHVCEKCATAEQLKRTTPELQAAAAALAAAEPKAEGKG